MIESIYIAAPLFTPEERRFNEGLAHLLGQRFRVFLPQRDGTLYIEEVAEGKEPESVKQDIFLKDVEAIRRSDSIFAVLNGRAVDEGVCVELGIAWALGKRCIGYKTDWRQLVPFGDNPMIEGALEVTLRSMEEVEGFFCLNGRQDDMLSF